MRSLPRLFRVGVVSAVAVGTVGAVPAARAAAGPPVRAPMTFEGQLTSIERQGKDCRFTAHLAADVSTQTTGNPEGYRARIEARWTAECPSSPDLVAIIGSADVRMNVSTSMSGNPEGYRVTGKGTNVSTTMGGTPEGFMFRGVSTSMGGTPEG